MNRNAVLFSLLLMLSCGSSAAGKEKHPWKDMYVEVGDIRIHYLEAGAGERVLVFIPGWLLTAEVWRHQIPYFSARGFRVLALDPRSHGQTTKTQGGNTLHQQAADLHAFLQKLKIAHSCLVGYASGATVLLEYISSPETFRPEKVVLVEGSPAVFGYEDCPSPAAVQQARALLLGLQEDRVKASNQFVRSLFKNRQPEYLIKELVDGSLKTPVGAAISLYFDLLTGDRQPALARMAVPNLIVTDAANRAAAEFLKSKIPQSRLEVIEDAGSAVFLDKPQAFNQILESFLGAH